MGSEELGKRGHALLISDSFGKEIPSPFSNTSLPRKHSSNLGDQKIVSSHNCGDLMIPWHGPFIRPADSLSTPILSYLSAARASRGRGISRREEQPKRPHPRFPLMKLPHLYLSTAPLIFRKRGILKSKSLTIDDSELVSTLFVLLHLSFSDGSARLRNNNWSEVYELKYGIPSPG
ncbi:cellulose synthase catalytic subunit [Striga asiatica]|uniref:Cellulose synthase catalytic subunit n=1 Tax=Striga asiatica TaxID=4170 RepID=A0A5A7Q3S8_STRAF|nr:cellulose synthase catalytic subunit [Striga asiatica]